jgi:hypothetical protein
MRKILFSFLPVHAQMKSVIPPDAEVDGCVGGEVHAVPVQDGVGTPPSSLALPLSSTSVIRIHKQIVVIFYSCRLDGNSAVLSVAR